MKTIRIISAFLVLTLSACATPVTVSPQGSFGDVEREKQKQKELVYKNYIQDSDRVYNLAFPLVTVNSGFCGDNVEPAFGMTGWSIHSVPAEYKMAARNVYNLQDRPAVQFVADNSPAHRAGIRSGDFIVAINGQKVGAGKNALQKASASLKEAGFADSTMTLERDGKQYTVKLSPLDGCSWPVRVDFNDPTLNAFFDGRQIGIAKGMIRFVQNDNELALVIAHELGHGAMLHIKKKQQNALVGQMGGFVLDGLLAAAGVSTNGQFTHMGGNLGVMQHSVAFEQEADYVGMYFMARAGYNTAGVADFWRRVGAETPSDLNSGALRSHPSSPQRFLAIEATHQEIAAKKLRKEDLMPKMVQR